MGVKLDLNAIRTRIKLILDTQNTTTASFHDLSSGLSKRVQKIYKFNPSKIQPQASSFPCICIYSESKNVNLETIAVNQLNTNRRSDYRLNLAGLIFNQNFSNSAEDPADEDAEKLMENIEYILRNYPNLDTLSNVRYQKPEAVSYFDTVLSEQTHLRAGVLDLLVVTDY